MRNTQADYDFLLQCWEEKNELLDRAGKALAELLDRTEYLWDMGPDPTREGGQSDRLKAAIAEARAVVELLP